MFFTVPFPRNTTHFVGRNKELDLLEETLKTSKKVGINYAGLSGMGGIGKTQLAVEFCYRAQNKGLFPDGIFWINAASDLRQEFSDLALELVQTALIPGDEKGLKDFLRMSFDLNELHDLVDDLEIDKDELGQTKTPFIRDLISLCKRQGRIRELSQKASDLRPDVRSRGQDEQIKQIFDYLAQNSNSLIVFDNVAEPNDLDRSLALEMVPTKLPCSILITTRRQNLHKFLPISLETLELEDALKLLLNHPTREHIFIDQNHPEREVAAEICQMVGYFPLALEVAGAQLGKHASAPLLIYRNTLLKRGAISTIDNSTLSVETAYELGLEAVLQEQWNGLESDEARTVLMIAAQFAEAAEIPIARLGAMAGLKLKDEAEDFFADISIDEALRRLTERSLMEKLAENDAPLWQIDIRLHPLVREFANLNDLGLKLNAKSKFSSIAEFKQQCAKNLIDKYESVSFLERQIKQRGIHAIINDLIAALHFLHSEKNLDTTNQIENRIEILLKILRREIYSLKNWNPKNNPSLFLQQLFYRAWELELEHFMSEAKKLLTERSSSKQNDLYPFFSPSLCALNESTTLIQTLAGHKHNVEDVTLTPKSNKIVSASRDKKLKIWDLNTGGEERTLEGHLNRINAVVVTPDEKYAVSASEDKTIKVWNLSTGKEERTLRGHAKSVLSLATAPDGTILSASADKLIKAWDISTGKEITKFSGEPHSDWIRAIAVTHDGKRVVSADGDCKIKVWNLQSGQLERTLPNANESTRSHWRRINSLAITLDNQKIISASGDKTLKVWDINTGKLEGTIKGHSDVINSVAVLPNGKQIISASSDRTIKVWDLESLQVQVSLTGHSDWVLALAVSKDGKHLVTSASDHKIKIWDLSTHLPEIVSKSGNKFSGHLTGIHSIAFISNETRLLSADHNGNMKVIKLDAIDHKHTLESERVLFGHSKAMSSLAIGFDGKKLISASWDKNLKVWDFTNNDIPTILQGHNSRVTSVTLTSDCNTAISASWEPKLKVWDLVNNSEKNQFRGHLNKVNFVTLTPDEQRVVSASDDGTVRVWNLESGKEEYVLNPNFDGATDGVLYRPVGRITQIAITSNGEQLVSISDDKKLRVWDLQNGILQKTINHHAGLPQAIAFIPNSRKFFVLSSDGSVKMGATTQNNLVPIIRFDTPLQSLAISPSGTQIAIGDEAGNMYVFEIENIKFH